MNRRQKRQLVHSAKMTAVCLAALYLAVGVTVIGTEGSRSRAEAMTEKVHLEEAPKKVTISELSHETLNVEVVASPDDEIVQSIDLDSKECYLLAKIAMAEAEGEDTEGKALVIMVVLNRVWNDKFPDSIEEVIMQRNQFSVTQEGGRWWRVEPDEDCYKALNMVMNEQWDESQGALYFESEGKSTWHQDNLEYLFEHGNHYFYADKEK